MDKILEDKEAPLAQFLVQFVPRVSTALLHICDVQK
jgi:hypothetical protein